MRKHIITNDYDAAMKAVQIINEYADNKHSSGCAHIEPGVGVYVYADTEFEFAELNRELRVRGSKLAIDMKSGRQFWMMNEKEQTNYLRSINSSWQNTEEEIKIRFQAGVFAEKWLNNIAKDCGASNNKNN